MATNISHSNTNGVVKGLVATVIGVTVSSVIDSIIEPNPDLKWIETAWIVSPTGKTVVELPYNLAMRIHRKRGWKFSSFEPYIPWWEIRFHGVIIRPLAQGYKSLIALMPTIVASSIIVSAMKSLKQVA